MTSRCRTSSGLAYIYRVHRTARLINTYVRTYVVSFPDPHVRAGAREGLGTRLVRT